MSGSQVSAEQLVHPIHPRPRYVGHQAGRWAESQFHEPGRHLPGVDRLELEPGRVISLTLRAAGIQEIYALLNPEKLAYLQQQLSNAGSLPSFAP